MNTTEEWLPVPGYEHYEVSRTGRVRSKDRRVGSRNLLRRGMELKASVGELGYPKAVLYCEGKPRTFRVHSLVMLAFVGARPHGLVTRHLDGDPSNNCLENLTYGTQSENMLDAVGHGTLRVGGKSHASKLSDDQAREAWERIKSGERDASIARSFGVKRSCIRNIRRGQNWRSITNLGSD